MADEKNKNYREKAKDEIFRFFLWILRRGISWIKALICWFEKAVGATVRWFEASVGSTVRWFETITKDLSEEARPIMLLLAISALGATFFVAQQMMAVPQTKITIIEIAALTVFFTSVAAIIFGMWKPHFDKLNLTKPLTKLLGKIVKLLGIGDDKNAKDEAENGARDENAKSDPEDKAKHNAGE